MTYLMLQARDPVIARDGRPFGENQGRRMNSLEWPLPSTFAGATRTGLGKRHQDGFTTETCRQLEALGVAGPFPFEGGQLYLPAPEDLVRDESGACHPRRPVDLGAGAGGGTDLPGSLRPVLWNDTVTPDGKQGPPPAWWSTSALAEWLTLPAGGKVDLAENPGRYLEAPARDERTHVQIDPKTRAAADGLLFSTTGLVLDVMRRPDPESSHVPVRLALRVEPGDSFRDEVAAANWLQPVGGERRLVHFSQGSDDLAAAAWQCPETVRQALTAEKDRLGVKRVRMILATPAIFRHGWQPDWLTWNETTSAFEGTPREGSPWLRLAGVANRRWQAVSGYSLAATKNSPQVGPKPIRRLTPAGSVYFFETDADPTKLADLWLRPVNDNGHDPTASTSGFGLAVWGLWSPFDLPPIIQTSE